MLGLYLLYIRFLSFMVHLLCAQFTEQLRTNGSDAPVQMKLAAFKFLLVMFITMAGIIIATPIDIDSESVCYSKCADGACVLTDYPYLQFNNGCYRCCK